MSMYFTAVASLMPLKREIPLSTARQCRSTVVGALCEYVFHCCCEPDATEERDSTKTRVYSSPVRSTVV